MNEICLSLLYIVYLGRQIGTWTILIQSGNCFNISPCKDSRSNGLCWHLWLRDFRVEAPFVLSLKEWGHFHHSAALGGEGKAIPSNGRKYLVLVYVEKAVNSLLLTVLNDANVERWANTRDQNEKVKVSGEQGTLEESLLRK